MNLTRDYKTVTALFESSGKEYLEESDPQHYPFGVTKFFQVGPVIYELMINNNGQYWNLSFKYHKMVGTLQELIDYFSELHGYQVDEYGLKRIQRAAEYAPYDILGLGKPGQVFGEMFEILKQFLQTYHPKCFGFACNNKRVSLYNKMFSRIFPESHWEKNIQPHPNETTFKFCKTGE